MLNFIYVIGFDDKQNTLFNKQTTLRPLSGWVMRKPSLSFILFICLFIFFLFLFCLPEPELQHDTFDVAFVVLLLYFKSNLKIRFFILQRLKYKL